MRRETRARRPCRARAEPSRPTDTKASRANAQPVARPQRPGQVAADRAAAGPRELPQELPRGLATLGQGFSRCALSRGHLRDAGAPRRPLRPRASFLTPRPLSQPRLLIEPLKSVLERASAPVCWRVLEASMRASATLFPCAKPRAISFQPPAVRVLEAGSTASLGWAVASPGWAVAEGWAVAASVEHDRGATQLDVERRGLL